ncbi:MAG: hypothetical protein RBR71_12035 [Gudongella sp.]|nr:hypothetical protein [Gudongella sp.]
MTKGTSIVIVVVVALVTIAVAAFMINNSDNDGKNSGEVLVTVSSMYIGSVDAMVYIDGELVQDTTIGPMSFTSANKKVSWNDSSEKHSVTVKVVYKVNGKENVKTQNVMVTKNQRQTTQIIL